MADIYAEIKDHFDTVEGVMVNRGKGAQGMRIGKKMFAMFGGGELILYLPPSRVTEIIELGEGKPHVLTNGMTMKNQVIIPVELKDRWIGFATEAKHAFIRK